MKKRTLAFASILALIIGVAASYPMGQFFVIPSTAVIPSATIDVYIDGEPWANDTELSWGYVYPGETVVSILAVENTGEVNATIMLTCPDLPTDWTLTWTENDKWCNITETLTGDLELYIPDTATPKTYSWNTYILAEQA